MSKQPITISPQVYARAGGIAYLIIIVAGLMGELFIRDKIIVSGDAAATAANIEHSNLLWRIGIAGDLLMHVCDLIVVLAFYVLLKPVHRYLALLAMLFTLIQTAVLVANKMNLLMPLFLLNDAASLKTFSPDQLNALSYVFTKAHGYGFGVGLIFFSFECFINGYLIFKSGFFPKALGILLQIAGLCYLINSFALIISPEFADKLFPAILLLPFIGELS
ncbi:MAG: DUF4386 domain-containing protein, partial [Bacteroidota bacterium]